MTQPTTTGDIEVPLSVNGEVHRVSVNGGETLLHTLRERLGQTSPRGTCGIGVCGTCTVLVEGKVASSCIMLTVQAGEREITTSEGLADPDGRLSSVQEAFVRRGAYQCSFCIPAMVLTVHAAMRDRELSQDVGRVREYLAGNLCRCGTYPEILDAVSDLVTDHSDDTSTGSQA